MSNSAEVRRAGTVPQMGGRNWKGPPADHSEVEGWHYQLLRVG